MTEEKQLSPRAPRFPLIASAEVLEVPTETKLNARTSDLSRGGCYLDTMNPFPVGTDVRVQIVHGDITFEAVGKVIHAQTNMGMGIAFLQIDPKSQAILEQWLQELSQT